MIEQYTAELRVLHAVLSKFRVGRTTACMLMGFPLFLGNRSGCFLNEEKVGMPRTDWVEALQRPADSSAAAADATVDGLRDLRSD